MTKKFLVFLIGFVFLGLVVLAQTPEENFRKAGLIEIFNKEDILLQKQVEIKNFFYAMGNDAVVSGKEMRTLRNMVKDFDRTQITFDKELEFYSLKTRTEIPIEIRNLLNVYFEINRVKSINTLNYADNKSQDIRKYFTEKTGINIIVEESKNWPSRAWLGFLIGLTAAVVVFLLLGAISDWEDWPLIPASIVFVLVLLAFLFLL